MSDVTDRLQDTARAIESNLPPGTGFVLLAFDHNQSGRLEYVANSERKDVVLAMREFIVKTESDWGKQGPQFDERRCPTCGQKFGSNQ